MLGKHSIPELHLQLKLFKMMFYQSVYKLLKDFPGLTGNSYFSLKEKFKMVYSQIKTIITAT